MASADPRAPYRTRWWKLAGVSAAGLLTLAAVTWAVFWIRPPEPARLVVLVAGYDNTLAVPTNPYGKNAAYELPDLAKPGGWLGTRQRVHGATEPAKFTRAGLPDLAQNREKCVVVVIAAHGGRDRDGAFLFPEDATGDPNQRVRVKTLIEQLAALPARKQKLLILDATEPPAYPDLGLIHNDFAAAVEELNDDIAKVPNLAVFMSTGQDQRSWTSPEWGQSSFTHHLIRGLNGAADANADKRISGAELVDFVRPRVREWARDNRAALQTPVLLPWGAEGESRVGAMHLAMTDGPPPEEAAPVPFDPSPELGAAWAEYRELARAYVPPTAYTPHLWRQYEAWTLRFEQAIIAGDAGGAKNARAKAGDLKRQIEAARRLDIGPQTLALQPSLAGLQVGATAPAAFRNGIIDLATFGDAERGSAWARVRDVPGVAPEAARLLWCRALVEWVADNPLDRLAFVPAFVPLVTEGMPVRPAEINFLLMLARHLPPEKREQLGPLLKRILTLRLEAETAASGLATGYPFAEITNSWTVAEQSRGDTSRREAEDLCFATEEARREQSHELVCSGREEYAKSRRVQAQVRSAVESAHRAANRLPAFAERLAHGGEAARAFLLARAAFWSQIRATDSVVANSGNNSDAVARVLADVKELSLQLDALESELTQECRDLLQMKPIPRAEAVKWWHRADAVFTVSPGTGDTAGDRVELVREFRRVSRQLLVTGKSRPEALPEVTAEKAREIAFETAHRRGLLLLGRLGGDHDGLEDRLNRFAFLADSRQSLAEAGSRLGELHDELAARAKKADELGVALSIRLAPAHADVSDTAHRQPLRRERVRAALAEQARRTYLDHWYGDGGTRYYHTAIEHLAADAKKLFPGAAEGRPVRGVSRRRNEVPARGAIAEEDRVHRRTKAGSHRDLHPAADDRHRWVCRYSGRNRRSRPRSCCHKSRVAVPTQPPHANLTQAIPKPPGPTPTTPVAHTGTLRVNGFFRGRFSVSDAEVNVFPLADRIAVVSPGLNSTALAVRADSNVRQKLGFGSGAVAIVLDCSGSLGPPDRKSLTNPGLYPQALKALDELLHHLPPGTIVNVWVFGERTPGAKAAEQTIREVKEPTPLPINTASIIEEVDARVRGLEPWDQSPIVHTALKARDRIKDWSAPFKAVVLISDCVDNRWADDATNKAKRSVRDALRAEFPTSGVAFAVFALGADKSEQAAQDEFREVEKLNPAGVFVPPDDKDAKKHKEHEDKKKELFAWLLKGLNPRVRFTLLPLDDPRAVPGDLSAGTATIDNWYAGRLEPGTYRLRVNGDEDFATTIKLERGDRLLLDLLLDLHEDRRAIVATRHWSADSAAGVKSGKPKDPWRLTLLQNRSEAGGLRLFTMIEDRPKPADVLSISRIGDAWFDVRPVVAAPGRISARWQGAAGYPAPAWGIDIPGWPAFPGSQGAATPVVEAWWSPDKPFAAVGVWPVPAGKPLLDVKNEPVKIGDTALSLESVSVEELTVDVSADGRREPRKCLVVRLSHSPGAPAWVRPVWARPKDAPPAGSEVRVYWAANKVTCVFWGIDAAKVTAFEVVSLNDALSRAEKLGHRATLDNIPGPTDTSPRPEPPIELR